MGLLYGENCTILATIVFVWITRVTDRQTDRQTDRRTDGRTDGRNCDSICALSIYAVARKNRENKQTYIITQPLPPTTTRKFHVKLERRLVLIHHNLCVTNLQHLHSVSHTATCLRHLQTAHTSTETGRREANEITERQIDKKCEGKDLGSGFACCFRLGRHCPLQLDRQPNVLAVITTDISSVIRFRRITNAIISTRILVFVITERFNTRLRRWTAAGKCCQF